ncbi:hypothetical protein GCM10010981_12360 [Dyella nitratireducens]|uniref:Uncharacterized protein n=1 Tax=Dyella nitratireducens TaxID=1849580 RepID=A0ABQ1FRD5_9GAMM|nr:hypothetical protein GCM10010981_12360 [Dyella nitratireducens]GLQ43701.1 hypothetical protein GCM10007902_35510 [Dyella nitratireducens]
MRLDDEEPGHDSETCNDGKYRDDDGLDSPARKRARMTTVSGIHDLSLLQWH